MHSQTKLSKLLFLALLITCILPHAQAQDDPGLIPDLPAEEQQETVDKGYHELNLEDFDDFNIEIDYTNADLIGVNNVEDGYFEPALKMGAQYVAAQAFIEGLFYNTDYKVTNVAFGGVVVPILDQDGPNNFIEGDPFSEGGSYTYELDLTGADGTTLSARIQVKVDDEFYGVKGVEFFSFQFVNSNEKDDGIEVDYSVQGDSLEDIEEEYQYTTFEVENYEDFSETEQALEVSSLDQYVSTNDMLEAHEWYQYDPNSQANDDNFDRMMYLGSNHTNWLAYLNNMTHPEGEFHKNAIFNLESVYKKQYEDGTAGYRFLGKITSEEQINSVNYVLKYDREDHVVTFQSWAVFTDLEQTN